MASETLTALPRVRVRRPTNPRDSRKPWVTYCTDCGRACALSPSHADAVKRAAEHVEKHRQAAGEVPC